MRLWGKGRSGFNLNCRIYSSGHAAGLCIHKPLSLRLLKPPVGPSDSPSVLPVCPLGALSRPERDSAHKFCNKRHKVPGFHFKTLTNGNRFYIFGGVNLLHVCILSALFGCVTQSHHVANLTRGIFKWRFAAGRLRVRFLRGVPMQFPATCMGFLPHSTATDLRPNRPPAYSP